jgi:hypothetical protein
VSSTLTVSTDRRGMSADAASFSPKRMERVRRVSASGSRVPSSPDARMSSSSSSSDRTERSSSWGSTPRRRTVQLAAPFSRRMSGPRMRVITTIGAARA